MKDVTLRQLEYFAAIAEAGSITEAARKCHVTQAGMSMALKDLEAALGVQLAIRRRSKGVHLTPVGRVLATRARILLRDTQRLLHSVGDATTGFVGTFTVGCFSTLSTQVLPSVAEYFAREHPRVALEMVEGSGLDIQERMLSGQVDVCFVFETQRHPEVEAVQLREMPYLVVLSPEHPLADREAVSVRDLDGYPAALLNVEPASYANQAMLRRFGLDPHVAYRSASVPTIREIVGRNLAWSLLLESVPASPGGRPLRFLPTVEDMGGNSLLLAFPRMTRPTGLAADLLRFSRTTFSAQRASTVRGR